MPDVNTEAGAESAILTAVLGSDVQDVSRPEEQKLEEHDNLDLREEAPEEAEQEEKPEAKAKAAEPEEDYVEIEPEEEGGEPTRFKVSDLLASHKELQALNGQKAQIIEQVEREATEQATVQLRTVEQYSRQAAASIQAAMQLLQPPQPPNADAMLNPASPQYDPDGYHRQYAHYQRAAQQFQQAQGLGQHLLQQANQAAAQAAEQRDARELSRLSRIWPEFSQTDTMNKFVDDMSKAYGFTPKELDDVLVDHRQALVARDALAYRAMKAQSGQVKAKVEAKAPKLVRSKQEAKGTSAQQRDGKGKFVGDAYGRFKKSHSDADAAAFFTGLIKSNQI